MCCTALTHAYNHLICSILFVCRIHSMVARFLCCLHYYSNDKNQLNTSLLKHTSRKCIEQSYINVFGVGQRSIVFLAMELDNRAHYGIITIIQTSIFVYSWFECWRIMQYIVERVLIFSMTYDPIESYLKQISVDAYSIICWIISSYIDHTILMLTLYVWIIFCKLKYVA